MNVIHHASQPRGGSTLSLDQVSASSGESQPVTASHLVTVVLLRLSHLRPSPSLPPPSLSVPKAVSQRRVQVNCPISLSSLSGCLSGFGGTIKMNMDPVELTSGVETELEPCRGVKIELPSGWLVVESLPEGEGTSSTTFFFLTGPLHIPRAQEPVTSTA